jgi:hypothetical protein
MAKLRNPSKKNPTAKVLFDYGQWAVTNHGIECLRGTRYLIEKHRVSEPWWADHMAEKREWVDMTSFLRALAKAREVFSQD